MQLLGVIGDPIEHFLSPILHNAVLDQLGLDYVYLPFPVKPEDLEGAIVPSFNLNFDPLTKVKS